MVSKLTTKDVAAIRRRYRPFGISLRHLAREYGVDHSLIWKIVHGKRWKIAA